MILPREFREAAIAAAEGGHEAEFMRGVEWTVQHLSEAAGAFEVGNSHLKVLVLRDLVSAQDETIAQLQAKLETAEAVIESHVKMLAEKGVYVAI